MFWELIAVFIAGFAGAGGMLLLNLITGKRLPKWMIPIGAGAAMLYAAISSEYSWYNRTAEKLPEGIVIAQTRENEALWRPWTYVFPLTDRFVAVNVGNRQLNSDTEGLYLADLYFFGRWQTVQVVQVMVDCPGGRRADPALGDDSEPVWRDVGTDDPIVSTLCAGG